MDLSVAAAHEAIAAARPAHECVVFRDRRLSWAEFTERTRRLANFLLDRGLGCHRERAELADHASGQDHLAICLHNGDEYLEAMLGAFKARVAPSTSTTATAQKSSSTCSWMHRQPPSWCTAPLRPSSLAYAIACRCCG